MRQVGAMSKLRTSLAMCILLCAGGVCVHAEDWPQWRGPQRDGVWRESGLLESFPEDGLTITWSVEIGEGYGGPAVADGRVFVTDFTREPQSTRGTERLLVLDESSGDKRWEHAWEVDTHGIQARYSNGPRSTPLVDDDRVYVLGSTGRFFCFGVADGSIIWSDDWVEAYDAIVPTWGTTASPLIDGERLYVLVAGDQGKVMAFDKMTGSLFWSSIESHSAPGYAPLTLIEAGGVSQLIVWHPGAVSSLSPETGEIYWEHPTKVSLGQSIMQPIYGDGRLYVSSSRYGTTALELDGETPAASLLWQHPQLRSNEDSGLYMFFSTAFLEDGLLYGVGYDGWLRAIDAATGERIWGTPDATEDARQANAFLVKNGDRFLITNDRGDLISAKLTREGYEEIDRVHLIEPTNGNFNGRRELGLVNWVHPAYANGHIVHRNDHEIIRASLLAE